MNYTGYSVLKVTKDDGAYAYGLDAYSFATGATGVGGHLNSYAGYSIDFLHGVASGNDLLPESGMALTNSIYTGQATIIGNTTPNGDIRGGATGFRKYGSISPYSLEKNTEYSGALYAVYSPSPSVSYYHKIGIGTTTSQINTSGYYEGDFTTRNIHEFESVYNPDLDDPTKIITGSGVYTNGGDVSLQFNILNRNGELLTSASQIAADPFVERQIISILDSDSNVAFPSYRINGNSTFTFSRSQNIDVFGSYNRNFGIRNEIVNADGGVSTGEFYLYANTATFDKVTVQASGTTSLNENLTNHSPPNTGGITSATDRADAIKYFNNQPINISGSTGFIGLTLGFNESPNFTNFSDVTIWNGTSGDFATDIGSLIGNYPLNSLQEGQRIELRANDGIKEGTPLFFKLIANSNVGFEPELLTIGPYTLEPNVEGSDLNLYNQGNQLLVGDFTIEGGLGGDEADGGNLNVSGEAEFSRRIGAEGRVLRTRINTDGYSIKTNDKAIISAYDSYIYSTGSSIMGGSGHIISGDYDVIAGGAKNDISGSNFAFIGGGSGVCINNSEFSSSIGGFNNDINQGGYSIIGGGYNNQITGANGSFIGGGWDNTILSEISTVAGGVENVISGDGYSFIGGGENNRVNSEFGSILGGENNTVDGIGATIAGGKGNHSSGEYSFIGGGSYNKISGDHSYAFGHQAEIASGHSGAAVFADSQVRTHASSGAHTATLDFANGVYVQTDSGLYVNGNPVMTGTSPESDTLQTVTNRGATSTNAISVTNTITANQVLGTGVGDRITNNHVPYLLSGDSPVETQTLQDVTNNGSTTTRAITVGAFSATGTANISGILSIPNGRAVASNDVYYIVKLTQAEYDAITPDASTMYIITDEDFNSPVINPIKTVVSNYTITDTDYTILVSGSSAVNIALPSAAINSNYVYNIKNITTNSVVVAPSAGHIDGNTSKTINQKFESIATQSDGSNWYII